jgi:hypothetical protein
MGVRLVGWSSELQEVGLDAIRIVEVERRLVDGDDAFCGILILASESARLYLVIHDLMIANGATVVATKEIVSEQPVRQEAFIRRVVQAKLAGKSPMVPRLDVATFPALCRWLLEARVSAAFFEERTEQAGCQVGRVSAVTSNGVEVETFTTSGEPGGHWSIAFEDLTRVDCLGEYERSFDLQLGMK